MSNIISNEEEVMDSKESELIIHKQEEQINQLKQKVEEQLAEIQRISSFSNNMNQMNDSIKSD